MLGFRPAKNLLLNYRNSGKVMRGVSLKKLSLSTIVQPEYQGLDKNQRKISLSTIVQPEYHSLDTIVQPEYHELDKNQQLIASSKEELKKNQIVILKDFVQPKVIDSLVAFASEEAAKIPDRGSHHSTVYYTNPDPSFPEDHPRNRLVSKHMKYITNDVIPPTSPLRSIYNSPQVQSFLEQVTEAKLFDYGCQVSKLVLVVQAEGGHQDWHFDNNHVTLTIMLQCPQGGGALEVIPLLRDEAGDGENYEGVKEVLDKSVSLDESGAPGVRRIEYERGSLIIFEGRRSLHRATLVKGQVDRIVGIISYVDSPEETKLPSQEHLANVYGKTSNYGDKVEVKN